MMMKKAFVWLQWQQKFPYWGQVLPDAAVQAARFL